MCRRNEKRITLPHVYVLHHYTTENFTNDTEHMGVLHNELQ